MSRVRACRNIYISQGGTAAHSLLIIVKNNIEIPFVMFDKHTYTYTSSLRYVTRKRIFR